MKNLNLISNFAEFTDTKHHGGVIEGDGQHLKIGYVTYRGKNVIVYIEQLSQISKPYA